MPEVYVLVAAHGDDPPEATVLGVFSSEAAAQSRKNEIAALADRYCQRVSETTDRIAVEWRRWLNTVSLSQCGKPYSQSLYEAMSRLRLYIANATSLSYVARYQSHRDDFLGLVTKVGCDDHPPPELPDLIPPHDGPLFSDYSMSIQSAELYT